MFCLVWFSISNYYFHTISFTILLERHKLLEAFSKFQSKPHRNPAKLIKIIPLIALILDTFKSWQDFNIFTIIALYLPGFYAIDFTYATVEMLQIATKEIQRIKRKTKNNFPEKHYHAIYKAIRVINTTLGTPLYIHVLLTTSSGLFFCYTHSVDCMKMYKRESITPPATYAPDFWSISTMILTFSLIRATHKLKIGWREVKRVVDEVKGGELQMWQLNYERIEVWAWGLFTFGNHVIGHVSVSKT